MGEILKWGKYFIILKKMLKFDKNGYDLVIYLICSAYVIYNLADA